MGEILYKFCLNIATLPSPAYSQCDAKTFIPALCMLIQEIFKSQWKEHHSCDVRASFWQLYLKRSPISKGRSQLCNTWSQRTMATHPRNWLSLQPFATVFNVCSDIPARLCRCFCSVYWKWTHTCKMILVLQIGPRQGGCCKSKDQKALKTKNFFMCHSLCGRTLYEPVWWQNLTCTYVVVISDLYYCHRKWMDVHSTAEELMRLSIGFYLRSHWGCNNSTWTLKYQKYPISKCIWPKELLNKGNLTGTYVHCQQYMNTKVFS